MHLSFPVTLLYGGLTALLVVGLGLNVSLTRLRFKVYLGKELPKELIRPVRAHGNAAEWAPLGILLLALLEASGVSAMWLHVLGGTLFLSRALQAFGALAKNSSTIVAAVLNYTLMLTMGVWMLVLHFHLAGGR